MGILLRDLLGFSEEELSCVKFRFNKWNGVSNPLDEYMEDPEKVNTNWFLHKTKNSLFKKGEIGVCLLEIEKDTWLMTTVKKIEDNCGVKGGVGYKATVIERLEPFFGRVIIKYHKASSSIYKWERIGDSLEVLRIQESKYDRDTFQGFDNVSISYTQLKLIVERHKQDWFAALNSQQAVYLITDKNTGKLYVGSATSKAQFLYSRWKMYVENGHGGNVELRELVNQKGLDYVKKHFQYTILENYNSRVNPEMVLEREKWWKNVLCSRTHGYNKN